jgi:hypothetical protein
MASNTTHCRREQQVWYGEQRQSGSTALVKFQTADRIGM